MEQINIREIETSDYNDIYLLNQELGYIFAIEKVKDRILYITENTKDVILVILGVTLKQLLSINF